MAEDCLALARGPWAIVAARARGSAHEVRGEPCQDAYAVQVVDDWLIACVADGAGSARFSDHGSWLVVSTFVTTLAEQVAAGAWLAHDDLAAAVEAWTRAAIAQARATLVEDARARGCDPPARLRDFASTLVGVAIGPEGGACAHVGDGVIVRRGDAGWTMLSAPENGEYADTTYFVTDEEWSGHLRVTPVGADCATVVLMSDGAGEIAIQNDAPFAGFLEPMHGFFLNGAGADEALRATLDGGAARARSADDKALLWAHRGP